VSWISKAGCTLSCLGTPVAGAMAEVMGQGRAVTTCTCILPMAVPTAPRPGISRAFYTTKSNQKEFAFCWRLKLVKHCAATGDKAE